MVNVLDQKKIDVYRLLRVALAFGVLGLAGSAYAGLVGKWTFNNGSLADETGNFTNNLTLVGGCRVVDHALVVAPNQYAYTMGYSGPAVTAKTLVAWAYLDGLTTRGGSLISLLKNGTWDPGFDAIVYGERVERQWMAGSEYFNRTPVNNGGALETAGPNTLIQMAVVYDATNGITIYRNGSLYVSRYVQGTLQTYPPAPDTWACFGLRTFWQGGAYGWISARITEARIYNEALTQERIAALMPEPDPEKFRGTLILITSAPAADLFYYPKNPRTGRMWDTWLYFHNGTYYLYYLANAGPSWDNISLAVSTDGVHWKEHGPILTKRPQATWMGTGSTWQSPNVEQDGKWYINYSEWIGPRQTIFFAESTNLVDWTPLGDDFEFVQDERWYEPNGRWDCIWTIPRPGGGLYGYWTATPKARGVFGFGQSLDGVRWEALEPPETPGVPGGEVGAVERIGDRYYMLFGMYYQNWTMMTLLADRPEGPFSQAPKNRVLLTGGDTYFARFLRSPDGLLVNHHCMADRVYFGPLKTAQVDAEGTLRLGWWRGNEALKAGRRMQAPVKAEAQEPSSPLTFLKPSWDFTRGVILEGRLPIPQNEAAPPVGLFFEAPGSELGAAIRIEASGVTKFGRSKADGSEFQAAKTVNREWPFGTEARFRLLLQGSLLEFYLDDLHIEVYRLPLATTGRIGVWNGDVPLDLDAWRAWGTKRE